MEEAVCATQRKPMTQTASNVPAQFDRLFVSSLGLKFFGKKEGTWGKPFGLFHNKHLSPRAFLP